MDKPLRKQLLHQFYRGNRPAFCLAVFAALASGSLNLILSWLLQQLIDTASGTGGALPIGTLALCSLGFVLLCAALMLLRYASEPRFIARAMRQYKDFAFQKLTEKSIASLRDESTASYLSALTNDASSIEAGYLAQQLKLITQAVTFFGAIVMMCRVSPLMTLIAVAVTGLPLASSLLTGGRLQAAQQRVSDRSRDFTAALSDCLGGFAVVKTFQAEAEIFRLFARNDRALEDEKFRVSRLKILVGMIGAVAGIIAQLGVFLVGAYFVLSGRGMTAGTVILFVNLMNFMIEPVTVLPSLLAERKAALALVDKLAAALEKNTVSGGTDTLDRLTRKLRFAHVSFSYDEQTDVLHDISAVFEAGKAYAIVGASGSGKSTLLRLLTTGALNYRGQILLDGKELRTLSPQSLYSILSIIQQNVFVFHASVRDNVTMFRDFAPQEVRTALERAHLDDLIRQRGDDYLCDENRLSGGERQRVSIARSLLKRASVLLADEATAALDAQTAHQVADDILRLDGMTRIVVTHGLEEALLRRYDGILVMKDGRIHEAGTFDALMEKKGYFYALFTVAQ